VTDEVGSGAEENGVGDVVCLETLPFPITIHMMSTHVS